MNVLIVDDSAVARRLIQAALRRRFEREELNLLYASDGEEALETFRVLRIDLVLLDWNMPRVDGLGFTRRVRKLGHQTPIVMITSVSDEDALVEACSSGVNEYLLKPFRDHELVQVVTKYIQT